MPIAVLQTFHLAERPVTSFRRSQYWIHTPRIATPILVDRASRPTPWVLRGYAAVRAPLALVIGAVLATAAMSPRAICTGVWFSVRFARLLDIARAIVARRKARSWHTARGAARHHRELRFGEIELREAAGAAA